MCCCRCSISLIRSQGLTWPWNGYGNAAMWYWACSRIESFWAQHNSQLALEDFVIQDCSIKCSCFAHVKDYSISNRPQLRGFLSHDSQIPGWLCFETSSWRLQSLRISLLLVLELASCLNRWCRWSSSEFVTADSNHKEKLLYSNCYRVLSSTVKLETHSLCLTSYWATAWLSSIGCYWTPLNMFVGIW